MKEYIEREAALSAVDCGNLHNGIVDALQEIIKDIPAADVVEVRRGGWIEKQDYNLDVIFECSECGEEFVLIDGTPEDNLYSYCPNCGALMDGGVTDADD